jgi:hypothetical protein
MVSEISEHSCKCRDTQISEHSCKESGRADLREAL